MESNKQEKYNLMHDNPVASHASWMSKHAQSSRMSPLNQEKEKEEGFTTYDTRTNKQGVNQTDLMNLKFDTADAAAKAYKDGTGTYNAFEEARDAFNFSKDSIGGVNQRIDRVLGGEDFKFTKPKS